MRACLTCLHWLRTKDAVVGMCRKRELPGECYRFQFEHCRYYEAGETRAPYREPECARRIRDYSDVHIEPEKELVIVELLKQGVPVTDIRDRLHIGAQVMNAMSKKYRAEFEAGKAMWRASQPDPLDAYAAEFKRLLDNGASFYKVQLVTGINRQRVSAYVQRKGWNVAEAHNDRR